MPTISHFYGIIIIMFLRDKEHNPPHIHAVMNDFSAPFSIETGEILAGYFPPKAMSMVKEFISIYRLELMEMWDKGEYRRLDPID